MFCRPIVTDAHVQRAMDRCKTETRNSLAYNRAWHRALRLVEIKSHQARFMAERKEIVDILDDLEGAAGEGAA
jgi:hypothetical protein